MSQRTVILKILVAGAGAVGKTTLLQRVISGTFNMATTMTIGVRIPSLKSHD